MSLHVLVFSEIEARGGEGGGWYSLCSNDRDDRRLF